MALGHNRWLGSSSHYYSNRPHSQFLRIISTLLKAAQIRPNRCHRSLTQRLQASRVLSMWLASKPKRALPWPVHSKTNKLSSHPYTSSHTICVLGHTKSSTTVISSQTGVLMRIQINRYHCLSYNGSTISLTRNFTGRSKYVMSSTSNLMSNRNKGVKFFLRDGPRSNARAIQYKLTKTSTVVARVE